jgi:hypothetical protein
MRRLISSSVPRRPLARQQQYRPPSKMLQGEVGHALYDNEKYDFFAVSRHDGLTRFSVDHPG